MNLRACINLLVGLGVVVVKWAWLILIEPRMSSVTRRCGWLFVLSFFVVVLFVVLSIVFAFSVSCSYTRPRYYTLLNLGLFSKYGELCRPPVARKCFFVLHKVLLLWTKPKLIIPQYPTPGRMTTLRQWRWRPR